MNDKPVCRGRFPGDDRCEFCAAWFCKNPDCLEPVLTSTLLGARPSGCPFYDEWNSKKCAMEKGEKKNE